MKEKKVSDNACDIWSKYDK